MSDNQEASGKTENENAGSVPRLVRVCVACGERPKYSLHLESEWIVCPNGCTKVLIKGGAKPEKLEFEWNKANKIALGSEVTETPFDEFYDANVDVDSGL